MSVFTLAERVGTTVVDDTVFIARLPDGPILALDGTAAVIWSEALHGAQSEIVKRVAATVGTQADVIDHDVRSFLAALVTQGLLIVQGSA